MQREKNKEAAIKALANRGNSKAPEQATNVTFRPSQSSEDQTKTHTVNTARAKTLIIRDLADSKPFTPVLSDLVSKPLINLDTRYKSESSHPVKSISSKKT